MVGLKSNFHSEVLKGSVEFGSDGVPVLVKKKPKLVIPMLPATLLTGSKSRQLIKPNHLYTEIMTLFNLYLGKNIFMLEKSVIFDEEGKKKILKEKLKRYFCVV